MFEIRLINVKEASVRLKYFSGKITYLWNNFNFEYYHKALQNILHLSVINVTLVLENPNEASQSGSSLMRGHNLRKPEVIATH